MVDLGPVIQRFGQESVQIIRKGRTLSPLSPSGMMATNGTPEDILATVVFSTSWKIQLQEISVYGSRPAHFYIVGLIQIEEGDFINRITDGYQYKVIEGSQRPLGNYTHVIGIRHNKYNNKTVT